MDEDTLLKYEYNDGYCPYSKVYPQNYKKLSQEEKDMLVACLQNTIDKIKNNTII